MNWRFTCSVMHMFDTPMDCIDISCNSRVLGYFIKVCLDNFIGPQKSQFVASRAAPAGATLNVSSFSLSLSVCLFTSGEY